MIGLPENRGGHGEYEVNELPVSVDDLYAPSSCVERSRTTHRANSSCLTLVLIRNYQVPRCLLTRAWMPCQVALHMLMDAANDPLNRQHLAAAIRDDCQVQAADGYY